MDEDFNYTPSGESRLKRLENAMEDYFQSKDLGAVFYARSIISQSDTKVLWERLRQMNNSANYLLAELWAAHAMAATNSASLREAIDAARDAVALCEKASPKVKEMNKWLKELEEKGV